MPIPWVTVLQVVPWSEVIRNAPKVAEGAKKLWNAVGKKPSSPEVAESSTQAAVSPESKSIAALEARAEALEAAVSDLHGQMLAASELIKALADQNTQLIQRIETNRVHMLWLSAATTVVAIVALLGLFFAFSQHGA
jgi:prophage DNA circulation protein